ncbi:hypothetical protein BJ878DRAFT_148143 [Calycina marina]|uniref:Uncharacterized protein n=1 Tax=Calycina marina TaxID=1763456 RepID=A0A9P7Z0V3_9HELO|nr:hypothetical protein BJ878DRAFT_148143 [Calycina marina]
MSKRQHARNERALQDLIKSVPGNNVCADCQSRNPGWASWNLGIFICMWCASSHRKLGTHISKVKSLSIDFWDNDQVEHMRRVGNVTSNRIYSPLNTRPTVPFDTEEEDPARDRFIKQKYVEKARPTAAQQRQRDTGSTNSDDYPPAVPPKPKAVGKSKFSFGMRSSSSIFPMSSKSRAKQVAAARSDFANEDDYRSPISPQRNKPPNIFGSDVATYTPADDLESKLAKLRDMGFGDEKRNITVLKGLRGNLEKSIETLVRLEGNGGAVQKSRDTSGPTSQSRTPLTPSAGISFERTPDKSPRLQQSTNPFDMLDTAPPPVQPQSSQSIGSVSHPQMAVRSPYQQANTNPYTLQPSQSQCGLNQAFQSLGVNTSQPLFPHHTGGFPTPQQQQFQQMHQQSMTPPVSSGSQQQYYPPVIYENSNQQPNQNYNPFMQSTQRQQQNQQPQFSSPISNNYQSNSYLQQKSTTQSPMANGNPQTNPYSQQQAYTNQGVGQSSPAQMQQPSFYDRGAQHQQQFTQNPFLQSNAQQQFNQYQEQQQQQISQQMQTQAQELAQQFQQPQQQIYQQPMQQRTERADKRSILDLFNYPQLAPASVQQLPSQEASANPLSVDTQQSQALSSGPVTVPAARRRNPFTSGGEPQSSGDVDSLGAMGQFRPQLTARHISQESVDAAGWQSGRHSPDAWGTISARSTR